MRCGQGLSTNVDLPRVFPGSNIFSGHYEPLKRICKGHLPKSGGQGVGGWVGAGGGLFTHMTQSK